MNIESTTPSIDHIPYFAELKEIPSSPAAALWIIAVALFPTILLIFKGLAEVEINFLRNSREQRLAEDKAELQQRDAMIQHLQEQNKRLLEKVTGEKL